MKKSIITLLLTSTLIYAETAYLNQIRQTNTFKNDEGEMVQTQQLLADIDQSGGRLASEGVMGRSTFELITINGDTAISRILDTVTVSSYLSDAKVEIQGPSADPYNGNSNNIPNHVQRTQVGQGFTINSEVTNLLPSGAGVPEAASSVLYQEKTYTYAENGTEAAVGVAPTQTIEKDINSNENIVEEGSALGLSGTDITQARGEKIISIFMKPDEDNPEYTELDSAKIIIWPISNGSMSGVDSNAEYNKVPTITVNLIDLYPSSNTYLKITGGSLEDPIIYGNRPNTSDIPLSIEYNLTDIDEVLKTGGVYRIELLHTSPFETLSFADVTFKLTRTIKVNASIISSE